MLKQVADDQPFIGFFFNFSILRNFYIAVAKNHL